VGTVSPERESRRNILVCYVCLDVISRSNDCDYVDPSKLFMRLTLDLK